MFLVTSSRVDQAKGRLHHRMASLLPPDEQKRFESIGAIPYIPIFYNAIAQRLNSATMLYLQTFPMGCDHGLTRGPQVVGMRAELYLDPFTVPAIWTPIKDVLYPELPKIAVEYNTFMWLPNWWLSTDLRIAIPEYLTAIGLTFESMRWVQIARVPEFVRPKEFLTTENIYPWECVLLGVEWHTSHPNVQVTSTRLGYDALFAEALTVLPLKRHATVLTPNKPYAEIIACHPLHFQWIAPLITLMLLHLLPVPDVCLLYYLPQKRKDSAAVMLMSILNGGCSDVNVQMEWVMGMRAKLTLGNMIWRDASKSSLAKFHPIASLSVTYCFFFDPDCAGNPALIPMDWNPVIKALAPCPEFKRSTSNPFIKLHRCWAYSEHPSTMFPWEEGLMTQQWRNLYPQPPCSAHIEMDCILSEIEAFLPRSANFVAFKGVRISYEHLSKVLSCAWRLDKNLYWPKLTDGVQMHGLQRLLFLKNVQLDILLARYLEAWEVLVQLFEDLKKIFDAMMVAIGQGRVGLQSLQNSLTPDIGEIGS
ncbi:hypothetical protein JAAARDRAFT_50298 [Jaapia argillacea MUCL 33604]|uniref:Uncharacterized protein n=1 Tax=Jaapia argillacea MUCL 33604 TaxID=933084 RepID=A0A067PPZ3_9AGAM|nr:hypothetical protein JAAARDRAFT_50298 [Jaapia argillacea MUCL 33604]